MEQTQQPTNEELVDAVYTLAAQEMASGTSPARIEAKLMEQGLPNDVAHNIVEELRQVRLQVSRDAGKKNMIYGALWCVGGIVVTAVTFQAAAAGEGGRYVVAWGAVLVGGIQFVRGLFQFSNP